MGACWQPVMCDWMTAMTRLIAQCQRIMLQPETLGDTVTPWSKQITSHNQRMSHLSQTQTSHLFSKVLNRENCACKYCEALIVMNMYSIQSVLVSLPLQICYSANLSLQIFLHLCRSLFQGSSFSPEPHLHRACFC